MTLTRTLLFRGLSLLLIFATPATALELPDILGSHMVLQQGRPVPIWGKATPGAEITVSFGGASASTTANDDGDWRVAIQTGAASAEGRTLSIAEADGQTIELTDVLVGEVWHASGQSNMRWSVARSKNPEAEIAAGNHPTIRLFTHPLVSVEDPRFKAGGAWQVCTPETVAPFSAVAYAFGRALQDELGVPVGLVVTAWGGASAEAYTSRPSLMKHDVSRRYIERFEAERVRLAEQRAAGTLVDPATLPERHPEPALTDEERAWADPALDDSDWLAAEANADWADTAIGNIDGVVWYRKQIDLPADWRGQALTLRLGVIDDADIAYVNGTEVGRTTIDTARSWTVNRVYTIPAALTDAEQLTLAIRVFDHYGGGGLMTAPASLFIEQADGNGSARLRFSGPWKLKVSHKLDPGALRSAARSRGLGENQRPAHLYHGMIHPVAPLAHRGVIWYQGESNARRAASYDELMRELIDDWRALWDQPGEHRAFPFLMVQLANFRDPVSDPNEGGWGAIRLAQSATAAQHPNAYLATAVDIGEADDIHPRNKQEVSRRLALIALRRTYGRTGFMDQGPTLTEATRAAPDQEGRPRMRIAFDHADGLKTTDGQPPRGFAVRQGEGQLWRWAADATIAGQNVLVAAPTGFQAPFEVRYAWGMNPADGPHAINLINGDGLPAFPFDAVAD